MEVVDRSIGRLGKRWCAKAAARTCGLPRGAGLEQLVHGCAQQKRLRFEKFDQGTVYQDRLPTDGRWISPHAMISSRGRGVLSKREAGDTSEWLAEVSRILNVCTSNLSATFLTQEGSTYRSSGRPTNLINTGRLNF